MDYYVLKNGDMGFIIKTDNLEEALISDKNLEWVAFVELVYKKNGVIKVTELRNEEYHTWQCTKVESDLELTKDTLFYVGV